MKIFTLVLYICSAAANTCIPPYQWPDQFKSSYDCMVTGYEEAHAKIIEMGEDKVNEFDIYIKFDCIPEEIIIPEKEPTKGLLTQTTPA